MLDVGCLMLDVGVWMLDVGVPDDITIKAHPVPQLVYIKFSCFIMTVTEAAKTALRLIPTELFWLVTGVLIYHPRTLIL